MANKLDLSRHLQQFDPNIFGNTRVDVIGCGAVGGRIAMELAAYGVENIHIWDGDKIESHNVANQRPYNQDDMDKYKVDALSEHMQKVSFIKPTSHREYIESEVELGRFVFLAVDKMSVRKKIVEECMRFKQDTDYFVDVRMGVDELRVYGVNPKDRISYSIWEENWYPDKAAEESQCQVRTTVGDTAMITAGLAVARFRHWYRQEFARDPEYSNPLDVENILSIKKLSCIVN